MMEDPKKTADPCDREKEKRLKEWAEKQAGNGWWELLKLLFFGRY